MTGRLDPRDSWSAGASCTIAKSVELLSTRSAFLLMREAFWGATRFEEFVRRAELSEVTASGRLHELVEHGLLELEPLEPRASPRDREHPGQGGAAAEHAGTEGEVAHAGAELVAQQVARVVGVPRGQRGRAPGREHGGAAARDADGVAERGYA